MNNWEPIKWIDTIQGQLVWISGTHNGKFRAYGPHTVVDPTKRLLASGTSVCKGTQFMHYTENLLVRKQPLFADREVTNAYNSHNQKGHRARENQVH